MRSLWKRSGLFLGILFIVLPMLESSELLGARIKDIASFRGVRYNQLVGYGLVVGLNGTGDGSGTKFTTQSLVNMMERLGIHALSDQVKVANVAGVMVTAELPPFARRGSRVDVLVSSVGDAKSLQGGTLLMTPLRGSIIMYTPWPRAHCLLADLLPPALREVVCRKTIPLLPEFPTAVQ